MAKTEAALEPGQLRELVVAEFKDAARAALSAGVAGNELKQLVVEAFDALDGERVAARDQDADDPHPLARQ